MHEIHNTLWEPSNTTNITHGASFYKFTLGTIPLTIDYVAKPAGTGIYTVVDGSDGMMKWGLGPCKQSLHMFRQSKLTCSFQTV